MPAPQAPPRRLSATQARYLHLAAQGLLAPPSRRAQKPDLAAAIARMELLQIDTIHVVARSPYFVLWSRLGHYRPEWLLELLAERAIFECWAHEACFAPLARYPLHRAHNLAERGHWALKHARSRHAGERADMDRLLAEIARRGPVRSADFERRGVGAGWWGWKLEKRWLEAWFALGELMIARREGFQRVYDLRERVLEGTPYAALDDRSLPAPDAWRREFALAAVRALGVAEARWVADYFRVRPACRDAELAALVAEGELLEVSVEGWSRPGYVHREHAALLARAAAGRLRATHTTLLSPFDPVVWDRARAQAMFGFDYRIECYTPAPKRVHGYFVLPILHRGRLVGRVDAKAHRGAGVFELKALHLEPGFEPTARDRAAIVAALASCAAWHGTPRLKLGRVRPGAARASFAAAIAAARASG